MRRLTHRDTATMTHAQADSQRHCDDAHAQADSQRHCVLRLLAWRPGAHSVQGSMGSAVGILMKVAAHGSHTSFVGLLSSPAPHSTERNRISVINEYS